MSEYLQNQTTPVILKAGTDPEFVGRRGGGGVLIELFSKTFQLNKVCYLHTNQEFFC